LRDIVAARDWSVVLETDELVVFTTLLNAATVTT
jgi:hypothetical protein